MVSARPNGAVTRQKGGSVTSIRRKLRMPRVLTPAATEDQELARLREEEAAWSLRKKLALRAVTRRGESYLTGNIIRA